MAQRKLKRLKEIYKMVDALELSNIKEFKEAMKFELTQDEVDFSRLRHFKLANGVEVYTMLWKNYEEKLRNENISSSTLIQAYHHVYSNTYAKAVFAEVVKHYRGY